VAGFFGGIGEVDLADGKLAKILFCASYPAASKNVADLFKLPKQEA
jgi:hypothetical protein